MRNRNGSQHATESFESEEVIMDTAQQRAVIAELDATAVSHARTWRCAFGLLSGAVGLAFTWFAARQTAEYWTGYRHHAVFRNVLPGISVAAAEGVSASCMLLTAAVLLLGLPSGSRGASSDSEQRFLLKWKQHQLERCIYTAGGVALIWVGSIVTAGRGADAISFQSQLKLMWLPAFPILFPTLGGAILRSQADSIAAIASLKTQMYAHETV